MQSANASPKLCLAAILGLDEDGQYVHEPTVFFAQDESEAEEKIIFHRSEFYPDDAICTDARWEALADEEYEILKKELCELDRLGVPWKLFVTSICADQEDQSSTRLTTRLFYVPGDGCEDPELVCQIADDRAGKIFPWREGWKVSVVTSVVERETLFPS